MNARELAALAPLLAERLELAVASAASFFEQVSGRRLTTTELNRLHDLLAWHLSHAAATGLGRGLAADFPGDGGPKH